MSGGQIDDEKTKQPDKEIQMKIRTQTKAKKLERRAEKEVSEWNISRAWS